MVKISAEAKNLIELGKHQGFLTLDDLLKVFPDAEVRIEELDMVYQKLLEANVDVFESVTEDDIKSDEKAVVELEKEIESLAKLTVGITTDPVRMYLREIGRIPLLKSAEEVDLAQRIEKGDRKSKRKLIESNLRLVVSIAR